MRRRIMRRLMPDISPVVARVGGYVKEIRFVDNQFVHAGDTLVVLDDRDYQVKLQQAIAALSSIKQNVDVSQYQGNRSEERYCDG